MFKNLTVFKMAYGMATHAGVRQAAVARNIANADTPGYTPRDVVPYAETLRETPGAGVQKATRALHLNGQLRDGPTEIGERDITYSEPNDNAVSLEQEMLKAVEVKRQHDRATAIYKSSLTMLRASLGR